MAETLTSDDRLARACIHLLGRHAESLVTARDVASLLPSALSPRGESKTRQVLRTYDECFTQPYRGWFQLGSPYAITR